MDTPVRSVKTQDIQPSLQAMLNLIRSQGYAADCYDDVTSEDGYLISLVRIPHAKVFPTAHNVHPVVLLMHGFQANGVDFILSGSGKALSFVLSDRGYDVWIHNTRGSQASRRHVTLDADKDTSYWNFTIQEVGVYDIPAIFDRIERVTGRKTLSLVCHSMGTLPFLALLSEKPEYNARFDLVVTLSQQAISGNRPALVYRYLNNTRHIWLSAMESFGVLQFLPTTVNTILNYFTAALGRDSQIVKFLLSKLLTLTYGKSSQEFAMGRFQALLDYYPDTSSVILMKHLGQCYRSGRFAQFDYGIRINIAKYGTARPPSYDLHKVTCPIVIYCSSADIECHLEDAIKFRNLIPNCVGFHQLENPPFNHIDFLFGELATEQVYLPICDYLKKYSRL